MFLFNKLTRHSGQGRVDVWKWERPWRHIEQKQCPHSSSKGTFKPFPCLPSAAKKGTESPNQLLKYLPLSTKLLLQFVHFGGGNSISYTVDAVLCRVSSMWVVHLRKFTETFWNLFRNVMGLKLIKHCSPYTTLI